MVPDKWYQSQGVPRCRQGRLLTPVQHYHILPAASLVARERAVPGVTAGASVLRELLLTHAADDPGLGEGGVRRGGGGGRGPSGLGCGEHDVPLHRRHARRLLLRFQSLSFSAVLALGIWAWGDFLSSGVRRARRLLDARRRPIGGHGPSIGFPSVMAHWWS